MRQPLNRAAVADGQIPPALRPPRWLRTTLSFASAAAIGFVPALVLSSPAHADPGDVTISDDLETEEAEAFTFDLRREGGPGLPPLTLNYAVTPTAVNGATPGVDFNTISGTTTFNPSTRSTVKRFFVRGIADTLDEYDEGFMITFTDAISGDLVAEAGGVLVDDDATPTYTLGVGPDPTPEDAGNAVVTATLSAASGRAVTIPVSTTAGTATAGDDYTAPVGQSITVAAGQPSGSINIPIIDDARDEAASETFTVAGTIGTNVTGTDDVTVTIGDNDTPPVVSVAAPADAVEGLPLTFPVSLTAPSNLPVTVQVDTANGSATAPADYTAVTAQTVTFAPGETTKNVTVSTVRDRDAEGDPDTMTLAISSPTNATLDLDPADVTVTGNILDFDAPTITLTPTTVTEGDSVSTTQTFTVTLNASTDRAVTVGYAVAAGTATAGSDFTAVDPGTLTFAPGETTKTFDVPILGDTVDEGAGETFTITLTDPGDILGASASLGANPITITDDDATPTFSVADVSRDEDLSDPTFTVTLSGTSSAAVTFDVGLADVTAIDAAGATGGNDFDAPTATLTIPAGQTTGTITVPVNADTVYEGHETATLTVGLAGGETDATGVPDTSTLTITNDDEVPTVAVNAVTAAEGTNAVVTGTVTGVAQDNIGVEVTSQGLSVAGSVAADVADFTNLGPQTVTIPGGHDPATPITLRTFTLAADTVDEAVQTVQVALTSAVVAPASGVVSITDDTNDLPPSVAVVDQTVAEGAGSVDVGVTLTFGGGNDALSTERDVVVDYSTVTGTAVGGVDYTVAPNGASVTIPAGSLSGAITVPITDDAAYEPDETFTVNVDSVVPGEAVISDGGATVTIGASDLGARPTFSVADVPRLENANGDAVFTVLLDGPAPQPVTFDVALANGTAVDAGSGPGSNDFDAPSGTLTIAAGQSSGTISVPVNGDTVFEGAETATLTVGLAGGETDASGGPDTSTLTLTNDDEVPTVVVNAPVVAEGGTASVTASVTGVAQDAISVTVGLQGLSVSGSDPAEADDFVNSGPVTVNIPAGDQTGAPVPLRTYAVNDDTVDEADVETVGVTVTSPVLATVTAVQNITDDTNDLPPSVALVDQTVNEDAGYVDVGVELTFGGGNGATSTERPVVVNYTTVTGTAVGGVDYTVAPNGASTTIPAGSSTGAIRVPIADDPTYELAETFTVNATSVSPAGAVISDDSATVTIGANDPGARPTFSVADVSRAENPSGNAVFTVALNGPAPQDVSFDVALANGTAVDGGSGPGSDDFDAPVGTLTILAGQSSGTINVPVHGDTVFEGAETATLTVSLAADETDATGGADTSTLTIADDDAVPTVVLTAPAVAEGGTAAVTATVTGVAQDAIPVTVTLQGFAVEGSDAAEVEDFVNSGPVTVTIPAGDQTGAPVPLRTYAVNNDTVDEADVETVQVTATSLVLATTMAVQNITDAADDLPPSVSVGDLTVAEDVGSAAVPVTLAFGGGNAATSTERPVVVNYTTATGTAVGGVDYTVAPNGASVTIPPGSLSGVISVPITDDTRYELAESFTVTVPSVSPSEAVIGDGSATVTIGANDSGARPTFSVADVSRAENPSGNAVFTVALNGPAPEDVSFDVALANGTAVDGGSGPGSDDFDAPVGTLTILAGQSSGTINVPVHGDTVFEGPETATLTVSLAADETDATGGPDTSTLTITNDDAAPTLAVQSVSGTEGSSVNVRATVTGVAQDPIAVTVALQGASVNDSDPAEPADFVNAGPLTATIPGGDQTGTPVTLRTVALSNDTIDEAAVETVQATVTSTVLATAGGVVSITDAADDLPPSVSIADQTVSEGVGDTAVPVTLTFGGDNAATSTDRPVVVDYTTVEGTATAPSDFTATTSSITIDPGGTTGTISVPVVGDNRFEPNETFDVHITSVSPDEATTTDDTATVTVTNDDPEFTTFAVDDVSVAEDDGTATFAVTLSDVASSDVAFTVTMTDGTAVDLGTGGGRNDYNPPTSRVVVPAGQTTAAITVPVNNDAVFEGTEEAVLTVALAGTVPGVVGAPAAGTLIIGDDDAAPQIALNTLTAAEGGEVAVVATVTGVAQDATTFDVAVSGDEESEEPAEPLDFTSSGAAVIPAGTASGTRITLRTIRFTSDTVDEATEDVRVQVVDTAENVDTATSVYRITDDVNDLPPSVALTDATVGEAAESVDVGVALTFRGDTTATERDTEVRYYTADGSARSGPDYTEVVDEAVTIPAGQTSATITVPITDDTVDEVDQDFTVRVRSVSPTEALIADGVAAVRITDDDAPAVPTVVAPEQRIGAGAVSLTGTAGEGVRVELLSAPYAGGTATVVASTVADNAGAYSFSRTIPVPARLTTRAAGMVSAPALVRIQHAPTFTASSVTRRSASLRVVGNPAVAGLPVTFERLSVDGTTWTVVGTGVTNTAGELNRTLTGLVTGSTLTYRAIIAGNVTAGYVAGTSPARAVTIR